MPVVDRACIDVSNVTAGFACGLQPALVLSEPIGFVQPTDGYIVGMCVEAFKRVYLFEEIEIALVAPL